MSNIENKIKEVADYFKQKVINGDFKFISCNEYNAQIIINDIYKFELWIANTPKDNFNFYGNDFLGLRDGTEYIKFTTQKERLAAWKQVKPYVDEYRNNTLKREKQKEFNRLKKELEKLNNE